MSNGGVKTVNHATISIQNAVFTALKLALRKINYPERKSLIPWIVSTPGIGKTEMITYYAKQKGLSVLACEPGLEREEKFGGLPDIVKKNFIEDEDGLIISISDSSNKDSVEKLTTEWTMPELIDKLWEMSTKNSKGVVCFLDDIHTCSGAVQNIMFELFTHRSINRYKVPNNVAFIMAGNDSPMAGAQLIFTAIRNRCIELHATPDVNFWLKNYAIQNNVHESVIGFFQNMDNHRWFCTEESNFEQFASPRSWDQGVSEYLLMLDESGEINNLNDNSNISIQKDLRCTVEGCVGKEAATKFLEWLFLYKDINVDELFNNGILNIPNDPVRKIAYSSVITNEFYRRKCKNESDTECSKNFLKVLDYFINKEKEISIKMMYNLCYKKKNEKFGLLSGVDIIKNMITNKEISNELLQNMRIEFSVMSKFA